MVINYGCRKVGFSTTDHQIDGFSTSFLLTLGVPLAIHVSLGFSRARGVQISSILDNN